MKRKKAFVVAMGKEKPGSWEAKLLKHWDRKTKRRIPAKREFLRLPQVRKIGQKIVIDFKHEISNDFLGALEIVSAAARPALETQRVNAERIRIIRQLHSLGYSIAVPVYKRMHSPGFIGKIKKKLGGKIRFYNAEEPVRDTAVLKTSGKKIREGEPSTLWARDQWSKAGGKRHRRNLGGKKNIFGEHGLFVSLGEKIHVADSSLKSNETVKELSMQGHRFFFTEKGAFFSPNISRLLGFKAYTLHAHPDLFLGAVGNVLLVDRDFFRLNSAPVSEAARAAGKKIVLVPEKEEDLHPANFLVLEQNRVLVDRDARETIALLRSHGVEVVPSACSIRANRSAGGGLRCMVNEL